MDSLSIAVNRTNLNLSVSLSLSFYLSVTWIRSFSHLFCLCLFISLSFLISLLPSFFLSFFLSLSISLYFLPCLLSNYFINISLWGRCLLFVTLSHSLYLSLFYIVSRTPFSTPSFSSLVPSLLLCPTFLSLSLSLSHSLKSCISDLIFCTFTHFALPSSLSLSLSLTNLSITCCSHRTGRQ